ncbi:reductive dehalogenase [Dehalococcoides mccartyi]|uniref:Reductive dehalogenase n=2 Tax=Bacteria TaxID=2 RepID=A0A916NZM5_DEHMC|nr:reductive dehalogenase [Dehalococcoides mccartyi]AII61463.1 dehalogenase [Dehalococcoides mccartyi CG5]CAI83566.1 putative reductive dehalogenase [Dehalococcoides mccartyi CBDB1]
MSKLHSTVTRRDFMKALGLTGAGLGVAAATTPVFNDLDDVKAASQADWKRPWWVKQVDKPTIEIDWQMLQRWDQRTNLHFPHNMDKYLGEGAMARASIEGTAKKLQRMQDGTPGYSLKDQALSTGAIGLTSNFDLLSFINYLPLKVITPEEQGLPKYQGTPEENTRMMRAAMRFFGAGQVSVWQLEESTTKKLIYAWDRGTLWGLPYGTYGSSCKPYVFEDVEKSYETDSKYVIANNCKYVISYTVPMAKEAWRCAPTAIRDAANMSRYRIQGNIQTGTQKFLASLGYQALGAPKGNPNGICPAPAALILSGIGEANRINQFITPEEGSTAGGPYMIITDLPLAPDKPIDAGLFRFCHSCRKCAETCPSESIMLEAEPKWDCAPYQSPGHKAFFKNDLNCNYYSNVQGFAGCGICMAVCTFNVNDVASIHHVVKATVSTTGLLNSFLWKADSAFGYGLKDPNDWWGLSLPQYGFDSTIYANNGGYKK